MELASPTIEDGFKDCVNQGAEFITVQPFMLSPGRHSTSDIPNMVKDISKKYPSINYKMQPHFGTHHKIAEIILESL